jgi:hypothetical protein
MQRLSLNLSALMYGATAAILLSLLDGLRSDLYIYKNIVHILNLIYQFHIKYYSHISAKISWFRMLQVTLYLLISLIVLDMKLMD